ncbi:hypothetical protein N338_05724, partial [Podiceps cristatus]
LARISWEVVLRDRNAEEGWLLFKDAFLRAQELSVPLKKVGRRGRKPARLGKDLLAKLREKKGKYKLWKQGSVAWKEYRDAVWNCRDGIRKAKAQMELSLARDVKNNKKGFYRYIGQKRQAKESIPPLVNGKGELAATDVEKAEVLNEFFASVFSGSQDSPNSQVPEPCIPRPLGGNWGSKCLPTVRAEQV